MGRFLFGHDSYWKTAKVRYIYVNERFWWILSDSEEGGGGGGGGGLLTTGYLEKIYI